MLRVSPLPLLLCLFALLVPPTSPCDAQSSERADLRRPATGGPGSGAGFTDGATRLRSTLASRQAYASGAFRGRGSAGRAGVPPADRAPGLFALQRRPAFPAAAGPPGKTAAGAASEVAVLEEMDVPGFLPPGLRSDLVELKADLEELATVVFGRKGIVRFGRVGETDQPRLRLNLQADPHPGLSFVLLTR